MKLHSALVVSLSVFLAASVGMPSYASTSSHSGKKADEIAIPAVHPSQAVKLNVPPQRQLPELYNGCELTSLSMLLHAAGKPVGKMELTKRMPKDPTPLQRRGRDVIAWGNPNVGFVGDITGRTPGYGVYHGPVAKLLREYLPGKAVDLSGSSSFDPVLRYLDAGSPVLAWTTVRFVPVSAWDTWQSPSGAVRGTFQEHAVLIVGYEKDKLYINDPLDGTKAKAVNRSSFVAAWEQMGRQAVTYQFS